MQDNPLPDVWCCAKRSLNIVGVEAVEGGGGGDGRGSKIMPGNFKRCN